MSYPAATGEREGRLEGEQDGMEHGRTEGGKADRASELRESEIPVGMVPVICVMVPGL